MRTLPPRGNVLLLLPYQEASPAYLATDLPLAQARALALAWILPYHEAERDGDPQPDHADQALTVATAFNLEAVDLYRDAEGFAVGEPDLEDLFQEPGYLLQTAPSGALDVYVLPDLASAEDPDKAWRLGGARLPQIPTRRQAKRPQDYVTIGYASGRGKRRLPLRIGKGGTGFRVRVRPQPEAPSE